MPKKYSYLTDRTWQWAIGIVVVLSMAVSLALVETGGWAWFKTLLESVAPAWIQAVGSVAAIVAAAIIAQRQSISTSDLEEQKQARADIQKLKIIKALMVRAHSLSNDICKAFETKKFDDFDQISPELMIDTHHALLILPVFEIPEGLLALDVLTIGRSLGIMHENWLKLREEATSDLSTLEHNIAKLDMLAREIRDISHTAVQECKNEITKRLAEGNLAKTDG